jgi:hypothetical protein
VAVVEVTTAAPAMTTAARGPAWKRYEQNCDEGMVRRALPSRSRVSQPSFLPRSTMTTASMTMTAETTTKTSWTTTKALTMMTTWTPRSGTVAAGAGAARMAAPGLETPAAAATRGVREQAR